MSQVQTSGWSVVFDDAELLYGIYGQVQAIGDSVHRLQTDMGEIQTEVEAMSEETRRWDMFLVQEHCAPNRCCFVSAEGTHLVYCGPCVVTHEHRLDIVRYRCIYFAPGIPIH